MEKFFYLNASNCKFITIGIRPASKLFNKDLCGFYVDVVIGGGKMKPMSLGGLDGFLNLCQSLRTLDDFRFIFPQSAGNYKEILSPFPLNISRRPWMATVCYDIETANGENNSIAFVSCMELLKFENLIIAGIKKLKGIIDEIELKFDNFVRKCAKDLTATIKETEKSMDTFGVDVLMNFSEFLNACIDQVNKNNASGMGIAVAGPSTKKKVVKRKAAATVVKQAKKPKPTETCDTNDGIVEVSETEPESAPNEHNYAAGDILEDETPLGLFESGQRFESEYYS